MNQLHRTLSLLSLVSLTVCSLTITGCSKKKDDKDGDTAPGETVVYAENFDDASTAVLKPGTSGPAIMTVSGGHFNLTYTGTNTSQFKTFAGPKLFGANDKKQIVEISQTRGILSR